MHNMRPLDRIELNYSCMTQVTETLQLQTEQASEIVKSPWMQRAMLLDSSLWYLEIFGISAVLSVNILRLSQRKTLQKRPTTVWGRASPRGCPWAFLPRVHRPEKIWSIQCYGGEVSPLLYVTRAREFREPVLLAQVVIWKLEDHIQSSISHLIASWTVLRKWADQDRISVLISILHVKGEQTSNNSRQQRLPSTYSPYDDAIKGCIHSQ